jgi:hypothetical protein
MADITKQPEMADLFDFNEAAMPDATTTDKDNSIPDSAPSEGQSGYQCPSHPHSIGLVLFPITALTFIMCTLLYFKLMGCCNIIFGPHTFYLV